MVTIKPALVHGMEVYQVFVDGVLMHQFFTQHAARRKADEVVAKRKLSLRENMIEHLEFCKKQLAITKFDDEKNYYSRAIAELSVQLS